MQTRTKLQCNTKQFNSLTQGSCSRIPVAPLVAQHSGSLSLNNVYSSGLEHSVDSKIPRPPPPLTSQRPKVKVKDMRRVVRSSKNLQIAEPRNIVQGTKSTTIKPRKKKAPNQTTKLSDGTGSKPVKPAVKKVVLRGTDVPAPHKARKVGKLPTRDGKTVKEGTEAFDGRRRRATIIRMAAQPPELPTLQQSGKLTSKKRTTIREPSQKSRSSLVQRKDSSQTKKTVRRVQDQAKTLRNETDGQKIHNHRLKKPEGKGLTTPRHVVTVVVDSTPRGPPSPTEQKPDLSLWKRIKKMSSVKIVSAWKTDHKMEQRIGGNAPLLRQADKTSFSQQKSTRRKNEASEQLQNTVEKLPSSAKANSVVADGSVSAQTPLTAKTGPFEVPPLTPRSSAVEDLQEEVDGDAISKPDSKQSTSASVELKDSQQTVLSTVEETSSIAFSENVEKDSREASAFSPRNPPPLLQTESCFLNCAENNQGQDLDSMPKNTVTNSLSKDSTAGKVFTNPSLSESPDLASYPQSTKTSGSERCDALQLANLSSRENNMDYIGMHSGRSPMRRVDSARIGAQCELIRDTIKEESRRVLSMTSLLEEAMNQAPVASARFNIELAQNREINRRQGERIHDLEMENQHLRQLLNFSIKSMRKESWKKGQSMDQQNFGPVFNNPIPAMDDADNELARSSSMTERKKKPVKGKKSKVEKEQIGKLQQTLESKNVLLRVITESICQISSMHSWYQKRLEDLERDRDAIQQERSECLNELLRHGVDMCPQKDGTQSPAAKMFRQVLKPQVCPQAPSEAL